jgi:hypothetical protein
MYWLSSRKKMKKKDAGKTGVFYVLRRPGCTPHRAFPKERLPTYAISSSLNNYTTEKERRQ